MAVNAFPVTAGIQVEITLQAGSSSKGRRLRKTRD
jgi:hypothetical protein